MNQGLPKKNGRQDHAQQVELLARAWSWVLRLRDAAVSQEDLTEWLGWYEADEANKRAFEEVQAFWHNCSCVLDGPGAPTLAQLLADRSSSYSIQRTELVPTKTAFARLPGFATAALVLVALAGFAFFPWPSHRPETTANRRVPDAVAQPIVRRTTLPDGSRVDLAPRSSVALHFTQQERALDLDDGEAYFSVARNRERPFVVKVAQLRVRAVGTAFNIHKAASRVVVAVTEGSVEVSAGPSDDPSARMLITAGHKATWTADVASPALMPTDAEHALAWQQGRLDYVSEPLSVVIADVNRYSHRPIIIRDEAIGRIAFSGTVFTGSLDVWTQALPRVFPVELHSEPDGTLILAANHAAPN